MALLGVLGAGLTFTAGASAKPDHLPVTLKLLRGQGVVRLAKVTAPASTREVTIHWGTAPPPRHHASATSRGTATPY
jgi:hypothetical protein